MSMQVYDYLLKAAAEVPDAAALEFMGNPVSYARLAENARKLANGLDAQGIKRGESIGLLLPNTPYYIVTYMGALMAGATALMTAPGSGIAVS